MSRIWSAEQVAIFNNIKDGSGHTVVTAMPGAGKTTTLVHALQYVPQNAKSILLAFNNKIAEELAAHKDRPKNVEVSTTHSYGLKLINSGRGKGKIKVDASKQASFFSELIRDNFKAAERLACLGKANLVQSIDELVAIIEAHEIDTGKMEAIDFATEVYEAMEKSYADTSRVDFDDMIWFPNVYQLGGGNYDYVFIDEAQDFTPAQLELALSACKKTGRIVAVGDPRQSISSFRGARLDSMDMLVSRLNATVLTLPVSYRCAKSIVAEAQKVVPEIKAFEGSPDGIVKACSAKEMERDVMPGDFIISRVNAPLVSHAFSLIRQGKPANIAGRDLGKSLSVLITKGSKARGVNDLPSFLTWLNEYSEKESTKLRAMGKDTQALDDKIECIQALCDGVDSVNEVLERCRTLFVEKTPENVIILTSTHKSKGLERERCYVLAKTFRKRPGLEEDNLYYVAVTRAKRELYLVS